MADPHGADPDATASLDAAAEAAHDGQPAPVARLGRDRAKTASLLAAICDFATLVVVGMVTKFGYINLVLGSQQGSEYYVLVTLLLASCVYVYFAHLELYELDVIGTQPTHYGKLIGGIFLSVLVVLGALFILKASDYFSRAWFILWFGGSVFGLLGVRALFRRWLRGKLLDGHFRKRIAIYGTAPYASELSALIHAAQPTSIVDYVHLQSDRTPDSCDNGLVDLQTALRNGEYDQVIISMPASDTAGLHTAIRQLSAYSTELLLCSDLTPALIPVKGMKMLGTTRLDVINSIPDWDRPRGLKSVFDVILALAALVMLSPALLLIALAIKLETRGPVFFRQRRYGQNGRVFRIFKFRTMTVTQDGDDIPQAQRIDPRVTWVGGILRRTSLDEIPQCFNVLLGDMSIVGPRPHALVHDQAFEQQHELFALRRRMKPGITGWAQVNGFRGELKTPEDLSGRMEADLYYVANWSIWLDFEIILRTCVALHRGAY